ncbi:hypothetical protein ANAEL_04911 [Anaerolineales bacterium]|jgi:hypothetical protein|nr:hypothetical protein ANAEL_04911 [Anaerolineales bacterium]
MDDILGSVEPMALDVASQAFELEPSRLRLFLDWLVSHSSLVRGSEAIQLETHDREQVELKLKAWFQSLPADGLAWEYRLLLGEIAWWRDLDPSSSALHSQETGK